LQLFCFDVPASAGVRYAARFLGFAGIPTVGGVPAAADNVSGVPALANITAIAGVPAIADILAVAGVPTSNDVSTGVVGLPKVVLASYCLWQSSFSTVFLLASLRLFPTMLLLAFLLSLSFKLLVAFMLLLDVLPFVRQSQ
jgi:hypothetical protein